jgi:hypothetical protein
MSLQLLENKALSLGIIGKSAPTLADITIRKSQMPSLKAKKPEKLTQEKVVPGTLK